MNGFFSSVKRFKRFQEIHLPMSFDDQLLYYVLFVCIYSTARTEACDKIGYNCRNYVYTQQQLVALPLFFVVKQLKLTLLYIC